MGYGKEYNRWVRENPEEKKVEQEEEKEVEPEEKKVEQEEEKEVEPEGGKVEQEEEKVVEPEEEINLGTEENEGDDVLVIPKMMTVKLVDILASKKNLGLKGQSDNVEKLQSMKDTLVEILSAGDLKIEEKKLLKEIRELIENE